MKRLVDRFLRLKREGRCGMVAYLTCGDPGMGDSNGDRTVAIALALADAGADAIELGVPFSDPIADGPVIQAAAQRALARGTNVRDVLASAAEIRRQSGVPLILFSYLNPFLRFGIERLAEEASAAGVDAVLITDLPPESAREIRAQLRRRGVGMVFLVSPTTTPERLARIDRLSDGFVYCLSTSGVTGARQDLDPALLDRLRMMRSAMESPLAVGFGVSRPEHYELLRRECDAVVVGSAIVRAVAEGPAEGAPARAAGVVRSIRSIEDLTI